MGITFIHNPMARLKSASRASALACSSASREPGGGAAAPTVGALGATLGWFFDGPCA